MQSSERQRKKKKDKHRTSGVTKLDRFLRGEPVNQTDKQKSVSVQEFATWLVEDAIVNKKLDPTKRRPGVGGVPENYVDDPPSGKSHTGPVRNPWGRGGKNKPAKGQLFISEFKKMENVSKVLEAEGSVISLLKAIDIDVPDEVSVCGLLYSFFLGVNTVLLPVVVTEYCADRSFLALLCILAFSTVPKFIGMYLSPPYFR